MINYRRNGKIRNMRKMLLLGLAATGLLLTVWFFQMSSIGTVSATSFKQWIGLNSPSGVAIGDYDNDGLNDLASTEDIIVIVHYQTKPGTVARVAEPTIVTLRGTLTDAGGDPIQNGSIRVTIKDSFGAQVWQDTFNDVIDDGRYNIPLGAKTTLMLIKDQIYSAILEVDAGSPTYVSADVIFGDNSPVGDIIKFVAD